MQRVTCGDPHQRKCPKDGEDFPRDFIQKVEREAKGEERTLPVNLSLKHAIEKLYGDLVSTSSSGSSSSGSSSIGGSSSATY